jgi:hypothetical protein
MAENHVDTESMPKTEPYTPTFDTGAHPTAEPGIIETNTPPRRRRRWWRRSAVAEDTADTSDDTALIASPQASSVTVPSRYQYLKWWKFILMLLAVWVPAGGVGAGLFYWWSHDNSKTKTAVVFVVLVYVVACTIAGHGARPAAGVGVGDRDDLGGVRSRGRRGPALRPLLLRAQPAALPDAGPPVLNPGYDGQLG